MRDYESIRRRHLARFGELLGEAVARLSWPSQRLAEQRTLLLRRLLAIARERSSWHRARLRGIDIDALTADDVRALPVMTKRDLMAHWDAIVTDPRVTLALANDHLETMTGDAYLLDEVHVIASGGSSGARGVFAWGWDAWAIAYASLVRWPIRYESSRPAPAGSNNSVALVSAAGPTHMTAVLGMTFANPVVPIRRFPVTLPMTEIVAGLNEFQPWRIGGYSSALRELARETARGTLDIHPVLVTPTSEPLLPEMKAEIERAWGAPVGGTWGTSEGCGLAASCYLGDGMHLFDDGAIVEAVAEDGRPVARGELSAKVYLTNLINPLMPLIRYEISDEVRVLAEPCPCGSAFARVDDIMGRADDVFHYGAGVAIHPHVFRSPLSRDRTVLEYQVRQSERGAEILVRADAGFSASRMRDEIAAQVAGVGLTAPEIVVRCVETLERTGMGKLKRFVTL